MKRPAFQFYPGDWLRDTALRSCSVAARGLWIEMLCLMHEGAPYGHLKVGSKVILPVNLARMVGITLPEAEGYLDELNCAGVYSVTAEGTIYSRRMARDEEIRAKRAAGGIKGGNPALTGRPKVRKKVNLPPNLPPTPASASASAVYTPTPLVVVDVWNESKPLPKVVNLSGDRENHLRARLKEEFWLQNFRDGIAKAAKSKFLNGDNDRGWKVTFDWFVKPGSLEKILEGKYDKNGTPANQPTSRNTGHNAGVSYADRPRRQTPPADPANHNGNG